MMWRKDEYQLIGKVDIGRVRSVREIRCQGAPRETD
jgi:hypothetical protein